MAPSGLWGLRVGEAAHGLDSQGVPIVKVLDGSPASVAGLKSGDLLCTVDGRWITSIADVYHAAAKVTPGRKIDVVINRDGKELTLSVTPSDGTLASVHTRPSTAQTPSRSRFSLDAHGFELRSFGCTLGVLDYRLMN